MISQFFQNTACPYFPCHQTDHPEEFNCLFCYCPLYALGKKCGGQCIYLPNGVKDCSRCLFPHEKKNYGPLLARYEEIMAVISREDALP